jgi:hypothetical protein
MLAPGQLTLVTRSSVFFSFVKASEHNAGTRTTHTHNSFIRIFSFVKASVHNAGTKTSHTHNSFIRIFIVCQDIHATAQKPFVFGKHVTQANPSAWKNSTTSLAM